ncbi:hypothetical protein DVH24_033279 [Malus domestica]|uniref:Uncharacterized protein n=1 Tax=Malus domestica TaxID=3750 RepID=A0A498JEX9_MALDO|nr:hypothetical protein DVH24_033279 [Malus domestica]
MELCYGIWCRKGEIWCMKGGILGRAFNLAFTRLPTRYSSNPKNCDNGDEKGKGRLKKTRR